MTEFQYSLYSAHCGLIAGPEQKEQAISSLAWAMNQNIHRLLLCRDDGLKIHPYGSSIGAAEQARAWFYAFESPAPCVSCNDLVLPDAPELRSPENEECGACNTLHGIRVKAASLEETYDDGLWSYVIVDTNVGPIHVTAGVPYHLQNTARTTGIWYPAGVEPHGHDWFPGDLDVVVGDHPFYEARCNLILSAVRDSAIAEWKNSWDDSDGGNTATR